MKIRWTTIHKDTSKTFNSLVNVLKPHMMERIYTHRQMCSSYSHYRARLENDASESENLLWPATSGLSPPDGVALPVTLGEDLSAAAALRPKPTRESMGEELRGERWAAVRQEAKRSKEGVDLTSKHCHLIS